MSEERIDHAEEAKAGLGAVSVIGYAHDAGLHKQELLAEAQAHATLALVEQQRIANLVAVAQSVAADGSRPFRHLLMVPKDEYSVAVKPEIADALGLNQ